MTDNLPSADATDERALADLLAGLSQSSGQLRAREARAARVLALVTAPIWGTTLIALAAGRLLRRRRPAIVLHRRVGHGRRPLLVPKIATASIRGNRSRFAGMVEIAEGPPVEIAGAARFETWLRRTGLDELPQLALIVSGHMRIVGPRPVTAEELGEMGAGELPIDVLAPGLVGLWQVLDRHAYTLDERRYLDELMVGHWSPELRRRIASLAAKQVMLRMGAAPLRSKAGAARTSR